MNVVMLLQKSQLFRFITWSPKTLAAYVDTYTCMYVHVQWNKKNCVYALSFWQKKLWRHYDEMRHCQNGSCWWNEILLLYFFCYISKLYSQEHYPAAFLSLFSRLNKNNNNISTFKKNIAVTLYKESQYIMGIYINFTLFEQVNLLIHSIYKDILHSTYTSHELLKYSLH